MLKSPKHPSINVNFNPSLNNKFKKRLFDKPVQISERISSRLNKRIMQDNVDSGIKNVPDIHKTLK